MATLNRTYTFSDPKGFAIPQLETELKNIQDTWNDHDQGRIPFSNPVVKGAKFWADVRAYGAVGDGTTNDAVAIQDAIDAVDANGGGTVFFPPLDFAVADILYVSSNITLQGCGMGASSIVAKSGSFPQNAALIQLGQVSGTIYTTASPGSNITIRDITLNCDGMPSASTDGSAQGIFVPNVSYFLAYRVHIKGTQGYGIHLAADSGTYGLIAPHIIHCILEDCGNRNSQDSIGGGYNTGAVIAFNNFISPNGTAIDNVHVENALWIGNRSVGASGHNGQIWSDFGMVRSRIVENYIENGSIHVYGYLAGGGQEAPHSVLIEGNHIKNGGSGAIYASAANQISSDTGEATDIRIIGNVIEGCIDDGIVLEDAPGAVVVGNVINDWDTGGGGTDSAIELRGGPNTALGSTGCVIASNAGVVGGTTRYYTESTSAQTGNNHVYGNNFPTGTVSLDTGGTLSRFTLETPATFNGDITIKDAKNVILDTTTGTKFGTGTTQKIGFLGSAPVAQQTSGANLTNNVTSGGTNDTIADFTDLTTYANDAAAIRNDIYQLARKLKQVNDALRTFGFLS
jgi:hypothetical protein